MTIRNYLAGLIMMVMLSAPGALAAAGQLATPVTLKLSASSEAEHGLKSSRSAKSACAI